MRHRKLQGRRRWRRLSPLPTSDGKGLKGYVTWKDEPFRSTQVLSESVLQCQAFDAGFSAWQEVAKLLTPYASDFRYPGVDEEPTEEEAEQARRLAQDAHDFVVARLPPDVAG